MESQYVDVHASPYMLQSSAVDRPASLHSSLQGHDEGADGLIMHRTTAAYSAHGGGDQQTSFASPISDYTASSPTSGFGTANSRVPLIRQPTPAKRDDRQLTHRQPDADSLNNPFADGQSDTYSINEDNTITPTSSRPVSIQTLATIATSGAESSSHASESSSGTDTMPQFFSIRMPVDENGNSLNGTVISANGRSQSRNPFVNR